MECTQGPIHLDLCWYPPRIRRTARFCCSDRGTAPPSACSCLGSRHKIADQFLWCTISGTLELKTDHFGDQHWISGQYAKEDIRIWTHEAEYSCRRGSHRLSGTCCSWSRFGKVHPSRLGQCESSICTNIGDVQNGRFVFCSFLSMFESYLSPTMTPALLLYPKA